VQLAALKKDPARHARRLKPRGVKFHPLQPRTRGVKFGRKPKLTRQQIHHARKLIDDGQRREDVAALLNVNRTTLYRALTA
jgi:DNA invertase Pin-like site-specific DNA recombinase